MRLQRGNQAGEGNVLNADFAVEIFSPKAPGQIDADARGLALFVGHFKRRIRQFHTDDERRRSLRAATARNRQKQNRQQSRDPHGWQPVKKL